MPRHIYKNNIFKKYKYFFHIRVGVPKLLEIEILEKQKYKKVNLKIEKEIRTFDI